MRDDRSKTLSPLAHPGLLCLVAPLSALALGVALAVWQQAFGLSHGEPRVWEPWMSLAMGAGIGAGFSLPQKRQLRRHRDFVASQTLRGRSRGLAVEMRWLRVVWPMLAALAIGILIAWMMAWPAVVAMCGVLGSLLLLYRECRSIYVLARRVRAVDGQGAVRRPENPGSLQP